MRDSLQQQAVGRLAQWESISFTPRGSGVQVPHRPPRIRGLGNFMKTKLIIGTYLLFLAITPLYGAKNSPPYLQSVLTHYFDVTVPEDILQEKKISLFIDFLKKNFFKAYQKEKCESSGSYYGTFQFEKDGPQLLWLYKNGSVHNGVFLILNSNLEVIYFDPKMGCLYDFRLMDLMNDGSMVLMVTHGAGGTGVYAKLTDLIKNNKAGIPELKLSLLKELTNHNINHYDTRASIKCSLRYPNFQFPSLKLSNGRTGRIIEIDVEATLETKATPAERGEMNQYLKKEYGLELNKIKVGDVNILLEDLDAYNATITNRSSKPSICRGYEIPGEERWPLNLRKIEKSE